MRIGHEIRREAVTADGQGEVVLGLGFMLMGENSHQATNKLEEKMEEIKTTLPHGVEIEAVYDRTELVDHVIETVQKNLFEGGLMVIAVLFIFLGNLRTCRSSHSRASRASCFGPWHRPSSLHWPARCSCR